MIIIAMAAFVFCICVGVGIYLATKKDDSPAPSPVSPAPSADTASAPGPSSPAPGPAVPLPALSSLKYDYVGEGGCTSDTAAVFTTCRTKTGCDTVGQQSNGCWHCLKTVTTGGSAPTAYKSLYSLTSTDRAEQRVYADNGTASCTRYCGGVNGGPWNNELPVAWGGATCVAAGKNNTLTCSQVGVDPETPGQLQCSCQKSSSTPWSTGSFGSATGTGPGT